MFMKGYVSFWSSKYLEDFLTNYIFENDFQQLDFDDFQRSFIHDDFQQCGSLKLTFNIASINHTFQTNFENNFNKTRVREGIVIQFQQI